MIHSTFTTTSRFLLSYKPRTKNPPGKRARRNVESTLRGQPEQNSGDTLALDHGGIRPRLQIITDLQREAPGPSSTRSHAPILNFCSALCSATGGLTPPHQRLCSNYAVFKTIIPIEIWEKYTVLSLPCQIDRDSCGLDTAHLTIRTEQVACAATRLDTEPMRKSEKDSLRPFPPKTIRS